MVCDGEKMSRDHEVDFDGGDQELLGSRESPSHQFNAFSTFLESSTRSTPTPSGRVALRNAQNRPADRSSRWNVWVVGMEHQELLGSRMVVAFQHLADRERGQEQHVNAKSILRRTLT